MNTTNRTQITLLVILLIVTSLLRLPQLGYSHFYGDETKTLYWNKTVTATDFFLNQRKGPVQFAVVWAVEKVTGGFSEAAVRLPFAIAGILGVFALYFVVRKLFDYKIAFLAALLFSLNGFFVAFSRTAQYQIFLILFGLLAILFALHKKWLLSSLVLSLAFLSHYDAIFFAVPVVYILIREAKSLKNWLIFVLPLVLIVGAFYIPYFTGGYAQVNTFGYLNKRVEGKEYSPNNSLYTAKAYNPGFIAFIPLFFALFGLNGALNWKKIMLIKWFLAPFLIFEFVFSNPGTHVLNYLIPLIILAALGIFEIYSHFKKPFLIVISTILFLQFVVVFSVFIPFVNLGFPWKQNNLNLAIPDKRYHLFLYGFPYNRGWDQIKDYLASKGGVRNFFTNDNPVVASYYLKSYDFTPIGSNYLPQYYVEVLDNQEFREPMTDIYTLYTLEKEFFVSGSVTSRLYRKLP